MFKSYDELRNHIKRVYGEDHLIIDYLEQAFEFGHDDGETFGFKYAVSDGIENIDIDDLPDEVISEIESGGYERGRDEGYDSGYDDGRDTGYNQGYDEGRSDGYDEGYDSGHSDGYDECKVELGVN